MLGGEADLLHGESPDGQLRGQGPHQRLHHPVGEESIGAQGEMGAVLLQGAQWPEHRAALLMARGLHLGPGEAIQTPFDRGRGDRGFRSHDGHPAAGGTP